MLSLLTRGKLTTLLFHKVPTQRHPLVPHEPALADFNAVLQATLRRFRILPLDEAVTALRAGNLPARAACITFDDGYPEWRTGVLPVLERHGTHATFFITAGQYTGLPMWNERILHAVDSAATDTPPLAWDGLPVLRFGTSQERRVSIERLDAFLKYQEPANKERLLQALERHTGHDCQRVPTMSVEDLRHIHSRGFGIGGHSVTHPILSRCAPDQAYQEIAGAREQLEALIGGKVSAFAYPNGAPGKDFGPEHIDMVRRAGYRCAVTTQRGFASAETSLMQIPRFTPWGPTAGRMDLQFLRNLMKQGTLLPEQRAEGRRALMVAFHFPPQAGSSGILRTLNFVKYLPAQGWRPAVLATTPGAFEEARNDLVPSIPDAVTVIRAPALDAARHLSIRGKYPQAIALPDRWSTWWPTGVWAARKSFRQQMPDLIWSTYPITTAHLIAWTLARTSGLPWVADFRDPMVNGDYPSNRLQRSTWKWLEAAVLRHAARCVFTTDRAAADYRQRYPHAAHKCVVIANGYDEDAFVGNQPWRGGAPDERKLLLHSGIIYPRDRDPGPFFQAVRQLIEEGVPRSALLVRFRAPKHADEVLALARQHGLQDVVEVAPPVPYRQAIAEMLAADLLLVFQGSHFNTQIPAKIYEYLRSGRPILGLLDPKGDTSTQLQAFRGVMLADIAQPASIAQCLRQWLDSPGTAQEAADNAQQALRFSRQLQAVSLAQLMSACVEERARTAGHPT